LLCLLRFDLTDFSNSWTLPSAITCQYQSLQFDTIQDILYRSQYNFLLKMQPLTKLTQAYWVLDDKKGVIPIRVLNNIDRQIYYIERMLFQDRTINQLEVKISALHRTLLRDFQVHLGSF